MKPNSKTQSDQGLKFDGAEVMSQNRSNKFRGNQHGGDAQGNFGRGPTVGNRSSKKAPAVSAMPSSTKTKNPDYINGGHQVRTPGGTRSWEPKMGQNYTGNPDRINAGAGPRKGNSK